MKENMESTGINKDWKRVLSAMGKGMIIGALIAWLFFQSPMGLVLVPFCVAVVLVRDKKQQEQTLRETEQALFTEYLGFVKEALMVGYSLEQAVGEGRKGMLTTLKKEHFFLQAVIRLERKLQLGTTVEEAFSQWAEEARCEDIREFAEVLFIAKRTGGAVWQVIENTESVIRDKQETMRYIRSVLHSREYEAKVMKCMPFAMLLYLRMFMPDYLAPLYHNVAGVCVMSVVLAVYFVLCVVLDKVTAVSL
jgi:tight adherence protein B